MMSVNSDTISVVVADNQYLTAKGYSYLLQNHPDYNFSVSEATTSGDITELLSSIRPHILIIDPYSLWEKVITELSVISRFSPQTNIMVVSNRIVPEDIADILECSVNQYLLKDCTHGEFNLCLEAALKHRKYLSSKILDALLFTKPVAMPVKNEDLVKLTTTEKEIIRCVAQGLSTREIALKKTLSTHTINTHRKNILKKLQMKNSSELVMFAVQHGMTESAHSYVHSFEYL